MWLLGRSVLQCASVLEKTEDTEIQSIYTGLPSLHVSSDPIPLPHSVHLQNVPSSSSSYEEMEVKGG